MPADVGAAHELARRLRVLRSVTFDGKVKQSEPAAALGVSVALISSWEREESPVTPAEPHLRRYARFFATRCSLVDGAARLLPDAARTAEESRRRQDIERNAHYLAERFGNARRFSILCHVPVVAGAVEVPDWTVADNLLHEWPAAFQYLSHGS